MSEHSASIGPYSLLEPLGHGGMGVVWSAEHRGSGQRVALKTIRVPRQEMLQGIRREIHALGRLRHPSIVRILDEGLDHGLPWYAMELHQGVTLGRWTSQLPGPAADVTKALGPALRQPWWTQTLEEAAAASTEAAVEAVPARQPGAGIALAPEALVRMLELVRRLCHALSYLHGEGLVHRDLKPDNVLVRPAGGPGVPDGDMPVLVDFGLVSRSAAELGREALEVDGQAWGTAPYMAPEQGRGETVDARADLYALGCILYELVSGRPPFLGETPSRILQQHLEAEPVPPSQLRAGVPLELDRLILKLLDKVPRRRLGYADDVSAALMRLGIGGDVPGEPAAARPYLYRPVFAGRQDLLARLQEPLSALASGSSGVVLIGGESGVGKTRLLVELGRLATQRQILVLTGECLPPSSAADAASGSSPLQAFRKALQAVADRCLEHGARETERLLGNRRRVLAAYEPALAGIPVPEHAPEAAELPPEAARTRLFNYLAETLAALADERRAVSGEAATPGAGSSLAARGSLFLLLDDLQWADELSLGFLDYWLRMSSAGAHGRAPLLMVGVYRSEDAGSALRKLVESAGVRGLKLERLDGAAVAEIVGDMLGLIEPPQDFARFLHSQSEGNPFFVAEYLRAAVAVGVDGQRPLLYRDEAGRWQVAEPADEKATAQTYASLPLPRSLVELVGGRLSRLSPEAQQLVEALSVLGREADGAMLADVSGLASSKVMKATLESLSRQVLESAGGERLRFVHDKLREVAYARLVAGRRQTLHLAAAEALEEASADEKAMVAGALASHWEQAGQPERSRPYHLAAARQARDRYAWQEAEAHYRAFVQQAPGPAAETVRARLELGDGVRRAQGQLRPAIEELLEALEQARSLGEPGLEGEILGALGKLYQFTGQVDQATATLEQALAIHRQAGDPRLEGIVLGYLAHHHHEQGRMDEARQLYEQVLSIRPQAGDRRPEGVVLGNLANLHHEQGRMGEARQLYEQALTIHREAGDRRLEGIVLGNLANLTLTQGRPDEAQQLYEQALAIHRQIGNQRSEGAVLTNLATLHHEQGRLDQARQLYEQALAIHRQVGNRRFEGGLLTNLATLHFDVGRLDEARQLSQQALGILREIGNRRVEGMLLGNLGCIERRVGDLSQAASLTARGEELLAAVGETLELGKLLCGQGHIELAAGRSGRELLLRARALADAAGAGSRSELGKALSRLERAQATFEAGEAHQRLFRGEHIEDLPAGLRRWLIEHGQLR